MEAEEKRAREERLRRAEEVRAKRKQEEARKKVRIKDTQRDVAVVHDTRHAAVSTELSRALQRCDGQLIEWW